MTEPYRGPLVHSYRLAKLLKPGDKIVADVEMFFGGHRSEESEVFSIKKSTEHKLTNQATGNVAYALEVIYTDGTWSLLHPEHEVKLA